jgi:hypothetical protein
LAADLIAEVFAGIELTQEAGEGVHVIRVHPCPEASAQATRVGGLLRERSPAEAQQHESTASGLRRGEVEDGKEIRIIAQQADRLEGITITADPIVAVVP